VWLGFMILQLLAAGYAFRLDGEPLRPLWSLPLQQIVYRQLMYMVVIQSLATALYGLRLPWQGVRRTGEMDAAPVARHLTSPPRRARDYRVTARGRTE
jgi:hypothetical protein